MPKFRKLALSEHLLKAIAEAKFIDPTEIQEKTIPLILAGKDVLGSAATGSGKTLAFGAGIIDGITKGAGIQALILTPTRELAEQIARHLRAFSKHYGYNICDVYGGVSIEPQISNLRYAEIVVGTPGRLLDHLERRTLKLAQVKFLVLDEADRMLDMGFIDDVERIIHACPKERQTLLFSATISRDIEKMAAKYMKSPVLVEAESQVDPSKLKQVFYDVPQHLKFSLLVHLLKQESGGLVMVFCNTRRNTDLLERNLRSAGMMHVSAIHGGLTQSRRMSIMREFHTKEVYVLICTDVAARGLDIKNVSHVYNYDSPKTSTEYIHRIGRTARAGKEGKAITLISERDYDNFRKVSGDSTLTIERVEVPQIEALPFHTRSEGGGQRDRGDYRPHGGYGSGRGGGGYGHGRPSGRYGGGGRSSGRSGGGYGRRSEGGYSRPRSDGESQSSGYRAGQGGYGRSSRPFRRPSRPRY